MADATRPATWADLLHLASELNAEGARYALIGGYAIAAHGYNRFSEDLDLLVDPSRENTPRWVSALSRLPDHAAAELQGDDEIFEREGHYAIRINDEFTVDIMPSACGHGWQELSQHIIEIEIDGTKLPVLSLEGLLLTKEGMRDRDRADRVVLLRALAERGEH
jgi:hypothetical protein